MSNQNNQEQSLPLIRKIGYGVGDAGSNFCWTFVASFIMIYCTNTLGISAAVVGTLMMLSKVLD
ncbi:MAG: MFS transporter, partial [Schaedlerella arabinosiphila]|nr:MFS transporter [Schaedlerella arabinosiphila]